MIAGRLSAAACLSGELLNEYGVKHMIGFLFITQSRPTPITILQVVVNHLLIEVHLYGDLQLIETLYLASK